MKLLIGLVLACGIGAACRWFDIPAPAPPALQGALLVVAMTSGYMVADRYKKAPTLPPAPAMVVPSSSQTPGASEQDGATGAGGPR
jgi:XapX domain-containing protein